MRLILTAFMAVVILCGTQNASHAFIVPEGNTTTTNATADSDVPAGCDANVWEAGKASAEAQVAKQVAVREGGIPQSESVLVTSCFDQTARIGAHEGGKIFSGDFTSDMGPIVLQPLGSFLQNNFLSSIGRDPDFGSVVTNVLGDLLNSLLGGLFGGGMSSGSFNCSVSQDLWDARKVNGINGDISMMTADELISVALNSSVSDENRFVAGLAAAANIFQNQQNALDNVNAPQIPSFNNTDGLDAVLNRIYGAGN